MSKSHPGNENAVVRQRQVNTGEGGFTLPLLTIAMVIIGAIWAVAVPIVNAQSLIKQHMDMIEIESIEHQQIWNRFGKPAPGLSSPTDTLPGS